MSVMARDHVLRTSNSSSGFSSHECDGGGGGIHKSNAASVLHRSGSAEESSAASSFSGFSSSHKGEAGSASSNPSPLLRRSLMTNFKGCPTIKVRFKS